MAEMAEIEILAADGLEEARPLLLDLMVEDQRHYQHDRHDRADIDGGLLGPLRPGFSGENVILAIRDQGRVVALCWCVIFDPGTGLEGEVAEVYVVPEQRGRGLATRLVRRAVQLFEERRGTVAAGWAHPRNPAPGRRYPSAPVAPPPPNGLARLPERGCA